MSWMGNMGPFEPTNFKGSARINGVPMFVKQLPLTLGGIAGQDLKFGRVVSINPAVNRREFVLGKPTANHVVKGVVMLNPSIMRVDPGMQDFYFAGRPVTVTTMGILDILEYDTAGAAPMEGSTVWFNNTTGELYFNDGTDVSANGYTKLNASIYETLDPNGAKVFFNLPLVTTQDRETVQAVATPTVSVAAGAVAAGTRVALSTTTDGATILYTLDGTVPNASSAVYKGELIISAAVTVSAIAVAPGYDPSAVLTAAYTIA